MAGAYVVLVDDEPVLYVERGGRSLLTLADASGGWEPAGGRDADPLREALVALADAVRAGRLGKLALERIDGEPAIASSLAGLLVELGFHPGPRRLDAHRLSRDHAPRVGSLDRPLKVGDTGPPLRSDVQNPHVRLSLTGNPNRFVCRTVEPVGDTAGIV